MRNLLRMVMQNDEMNNGLEQKAAWLATASGSEGRIERGGQIYRVHNDLDNTTVFFDRQKMIDGSILLGAPEDDMNYGLSKCQASKVVREL